MRIDRVRLASRLARYLTSNQLTQKEFADRHGVSQSTISRVLSGTAGDLRQATIASLERVLGTLPSTPPEEPERVREDAPRLLKVFVATPSDVEDEVETVREVAKELNRLGQGFHLDVVNWRSHAIPGAGPDPQSVVNSTMPDEYDVFVGIMWARFGTPTGRAGSGTEEEFERARSNAVKSSAPAIRFYFKDEPIPPSKLDPEQLARVHAFKRHLASEHLYWNFTSTDELAKELRVHLHRTARQLIRGNSTTVAVESIEELDDRDDVGFLDLLEEASEAFFRGNEAAQRMTKDTQALGSNLSSRTAELNSLQRRHGNVNVRAVRRIGDNAAADMDAFAERLETEIPIMGEALGTAFDATAQVIDLYMDFAPENTTDLLALRTTVSNLVDTLGEVIDRQSEFRRAVVRLPRLTKAMAKARRRTLSGLERLTLKQEGVCSMGRVLLRLLDETTAQIEGQELTSFPQR